LKDVFRYSFEQAHDCSEIAELVKSEKEYKKLIKLMTGIFEMVSLFMEETKELTTNLH